MILSWAVIGQSGLNHVNNQNNDYVIKKMVEKGLIYDENTSMKAKKTIEDLTYLKNTIMFFKFPRNKICK